MYLKTNVSDRILVFLIDNGSDISLVKNSVLTQHTNVFDRQEVSISGIGNGTQKTCGSLEVSMSMDDKMSISFPFFLVNDSFPVIADGIIGRDFLIHFRGKIDYDSWTLSLRAHKQMFELPIFSKFMTTMPVKKIAIPPRTAMVQLIKLDISEDSLVFCSEIAPNVLVGNTIVPCNGNQHIKLVNMSDQEVILENFALKHEPLSNFSLPSKTALKTFKKAANFIGAQYKSLSAHCKSRKGKGKIGVSKKDVFQIIQNTQNAVSRRETVHSAVRNSISDFPADEINSVSDIVANFHDVCYLPGDKLSANNFYEQEIFFTDKQPVYKRNYRNPQSEKSEVNTHLDKLLDDDLIEPSVSGYNSPILLVPKANAPGKTRLVFDYRDLNRRICDDKFPLGRIEDVLDQLGRARYWSSLDLQAGFHQISLKPGLSRACTAFSVEGRGHYQWKRLPFGLKISPNSFSRMMSIALAGLSNAFCFIDDILVWGCSLRHHNSNLIALLQRLRKFNLKINLEKCKFLRKELIYLGHKFGKSGLLPDPSKFSAIDNYPVPTKPDEVLRFVAFCNYYRKFIPNFAEIARPLNNLLRKNVNFDWTPACQNAFDTLRIKLKSPPVLMFPDYSKGFRLITDASAFSLGCVLAQLDENENERPVAYASRTLNRHEVNQSTIHKELLGVYWGIKYFHTILYGRPFTVITDHRPLVSLFKQRDPSSKLTRIRMELENYQFTVEYRKGAQNAADALSRIKIDMDYLKSLTPVDVNVVTRAQVRNAQNVNKNSCAAADIDRSTSEPDHLRVWHATSLADVRYLKTLRFVVIQRSDANRSEDFKIEFQGQVVLITLLTGTDAARLLGPALEALRAQVNNKPTFALADSDNLFNFLSAQKFKEILNKMKIDLQIVLYSPPKSVSDPNEQSEIISRFHNDVLGHFGINKTLQRIKVRYSWPKMAKSVSNYVKNCRECQLNKVVRHNKECLQTTDTPSSSFEILEADLIGPLPFSDSGNRYALTVQCNLTKFIDAVPIPDKGAVTVARALVEQVFCRYGLCKILRTDLGTEFMNEVLREVCSLLKITHKRSTPVHHETVGSLERSHRVFNEFMRIHSESKDGAWDKWLCYYILAYNSTNHVTHSYCPYELVFGKLPNLPNMEFVPKYTFTDYDFYLNELQNMLQHAHARVHEKLVDFKNARNEKFNQNLMPCKFFPGNLVKLRIEDRHKLDPVYSGPHKVISIDGVNTTITFKNKTLTVHNNRLLPFN